MRIFVPSICLSDFLYLNMGLIVLSLECLLGNSYGGKLNMKTATI